MAGGKSPDAARTIQTERSPRGADRIRTCISSTMQVRDMAIPEVLYLSYYTFTVGPQLERAHPPSNFRRS